MPIENLEGQAPEGADESQTSGDPYEHKALEMGWRPREEFNGTDDEFVDAKEFVSRRPLFEKIEGQSRELKAVRKALEAFKTHYTTVQQTEYNRAIADLKTARKAAMQEGDGDRFEQIDTQIKEAEKQVAVIEQTKNAPIVQDTPVHPEFQSFVRRNPWYESDPAMRQYADKFGTALAATGTAPEEVLAEVERVVKQKYPDKFRNPNKTNAPDVGTGNKTSGNASGSSDRFELNEQEKNIMNTLVRGGHITKEKYIADLKKAKGL
jgi:hypothetical protein